MIKPTNIEKKQIRAHWGHYNLKFKKDGTVIGQKTKSGAWGILYTPYHLETHIEHLRAFKRIVG